MEETLLKVLFWAAAATAAADGDEEEGDDAPMSLDRAKSAASSVAGQGIHGVRCRWGRVQEPSFLLRLGEVRLRAWVDPGERPRW